MNAEQNPVVVKTTTCMEVPCEWCVAIKAICYKKMRGPGCWGCSKHKMKCSAAAPWEAGKSGGTGSDRGLLPEDGQVGEGLPEDGQAGVDEKVEESEEDEEEDEEEKAEEVTGAETEMGMEIAEKGTEKEADEEMGEIVEGMEIEE